MVTIGLWKGFTLMYGEMEDVYYVTDETGSKIIFKSKNEKLATEVFVGAVKKHFSKD